MVLQMFMKFLVKAVKYEDLDASLKEVGRILISTSRRLIPNLFCNFKWILQTDTSNLKMVLSNFLYLNSVLNEISRKPQQYLQPAIHYEMLTCQNFSIFNENRKSAEMEFFFFKKRLTGITVLPIYSRKTQFVFGWFT